MAEDLKGKHFIIPRHPQDRDKDYTVVEATGQQREKAGRIYIEVIDQYSSKFKPMAHYILEGSLKPTNEKLTPLPYMPEHLKEGSKKDNNLLGKHFKTPFGSEFIANGFYKDSPIGKYIEVVPENGTERQFLFEKDLEPITKIAKRLSLADAIRTAMLSSSEALYGFCGWLTTRKDETIMSGHHDAGHIADLVDTFCKTNKLPAPKEHWEKELIHPGESDLNKTAGSIRDFKTYYMQKAVQNYINNSSIDLKDIDPSRYFIIGLDRHGDCLIGANTLSKETALETVEHFKKDSDVRRIVVERPKRGVKEWVKNDSGKWIEQSAQIIHGAAMALLERTADYPDHPDDIVISKGELLAGNREIKEIDIWNYYSGVSGKMLSELKGRDLFIGIKTKEAKGPRGKPLYLRHPYDKKTEYIRISSDKDFETYHSGRTVEYHVTMPAMAPYYVVDFDATSFDQAKKITGEIADKLKKHPDVKSVELRFTGKRGFHVLGWLKKAQPVDKARETLKEWLRTEFGDHKDVVIGESPKGSKGALGLSPMKLNGGQVALWSLRVSGLCCVEVSRAQLGSFKQSDATIDKVYRRLTGKSFPWGSKKDVSQKMARKVASTFLNRILDS